MSSCELVCVVSSDPPSTTTVVKWLWPTGGNCYRHLHTFIDSKCNPVWWLNSFIVKVSTIKFRYFSFYACDFRFYHRHCSTWYPHSWKLISRMGFLLVLVLSLIVGSSSSNIGYRTLSVEWLGSMCFLLKLKFCWAWAIRPKWRNSGLECCCADCCVNSLITECFQVCSHKLFTSIPCL